MAKKTTQQPDEPLIHSQTTSAEDEEWLNFQRTEKRETPKRLEGIGKFLSAVMAASLTFLNTTGYDLFSGKNNNASLRTGIVLWLLAIVLSFAVIFPFRYRYIENSALSIKRTNARIVRLKLGILIVATLCFLTGLIMISLRAFFA